MSVLLLLVLVLAASDELSLLPRVATKRESRKRDGFWYDPCSRFLVTKALERRFDTFAKAVYARLQFNTVAMLYVHERMHGPREYFHKMNLALDLFYLDLMKSEEQIVQLGVGFDLKAFMVEGHVFEADLPEVIELRQQKLAAIKDEKCRAFLDVPNPNVGINLTQPDDMMRKLIDAGLDLTKPVLVTLERVPPYIPNLRHVLDVLSSYLAPGSRVAYDVINEAAHMRLKKHDPDWARLAQYTQKSIRDALNTNWTIEATLAENHRLQRAGFFKSVILNKVFGKNASQDHFEAHHAHAYTVVARLTP